ncbi:MAG: M48 family metallopeptidase [Oligoflexia bacterium]|nr:M48 family metallopeptidase [Oligoflexia bacterium]
MRETFFVRQDDARKKTVYLLLLFVLCVALIILAVYFLLTGIVLLYLHTGVRRTALHLEMLRPQIFSAKLFASVAIPTTALVVGAALYKVRQLSAGGPAFARLFNAKRVYRATIDPAEQRLNNVVEEMALASGIAPPLIYVLENELGINAFAAGTRIENGAIIVTKGALECFNRDELQAVIGHEFSHILNGDMRMNAKLAGFVHGIVVLHLVGRAILDLDGKSSKPRLRRSHNSGSNLIYLVGGILMAVGWIGAVFARAIKSAASRQREFLADASSVQFTRNPSGLTAALKKIGGLAEGSVVSDPNAEMVSHLFFANGLSISPSRWFATHPPLLERIQRYEPGFKGNFDELDLTALSAADDFQPVAEVLQAIAAANAIKPEQAAASIGNPAMRHIEAVRALRGNIPEALENLVAEPYGARAVIYALLLSRDPAIRSEQSPLLFQNLDPHIRTRISAAVNSLPQLDPRLRMVLVNQSISALRQLDVKEYADFRVRLADISGRDASLSIFEVMLEQILIRNLDHYFIESNKRLPTICKIDLLLPQICTVLECLAAAGHNEPARALDAYRAGLRSLKIGAENERSGVAAPSLQEFRAALRLLDSAKFEIKESLLNAAAQVVLRDGEINLDEGELLRALAESLGVPIPPFCPINDS